MKKLTANQIRKIWLDFFASKGHYIEPGASLVPHNDPTLLWINSGVAALKKYFDGSEVPSNKRITNVQKSLRTNDVENVGHTARHHTFFEMLGNFSIGDYFRTEALTWAMEILTSEKYMGIPLEKLYFTYHPSDIVTKELWVKLGVNEKHLIALEGNFWEIGTGPCGPNTEIFFDRGEKYDSDHLGIKLLEEDIENDRYIEIWNIVFSQFNAVEGVKRENYKELPQKNIDTGAGLERIACVLQETETNFETDLFLPIIKEAEKIAKIPYEGTNKMCYRVIADHIRTCTLALADGASFANEGRGYVLRRVLRRAMRYGRKISINEKFLYKLVPVVIKVMEDFYPYLNDKKDFVMKSIAAEEEKFLKTLATGETILRKMIENNQGSLSGQDAFKLYDTYGFPIELTIEICGEEGINVNKKGFASEMENQKERARAARGYMQSMNKQAKDLLEFTGESEFTYDPQNLRATVIALFKDGVRVNEIDDEGDAIFDKTNFYAESGGQVADQGELVACDSSFLINSVIKAPNKQHLHHINSRFGKLCVGDHVTLSINQEARLKTMRNHSSVHLLQKALGELFGDDVHQQGSFVNDQYFRFDFNCTQKLASDELKLLEDKVNQYIEQAIQCRTLILPLEEAKKLNALSLFDEKYGDVVRVVCFGEISKEFCGGTHVNNSQDIGVFAIQFEESIASGIRRIQGTTGHNAYRYLKSKEDRLLQITKQCGASSIHEVGDRLKSILEENELLKKEIKHQLDKEAAMLGRSLETQFSAVNNYHTLFKYLPNMSRELLVKIIDYLKTIHQDSIIFLIGEENDSLPLVCAVAPEAVGKGVKAGVVVKEVAQILEGSGGGRTDFAFGAGKVKTKIEEALNYAQKMVNR